MTNARVVRSLLALLAGLLLASTIRAQEGPPAASGTVILKTGPSAEAQNPDVFPNVPVTNQERAAVAIVSTDLDLHLTPADASLEAHALLTLRNVSAAPLARIPLQLSSTLRWQSISSPIDRRISFTQSPVTTDTDHTGYAQEAVLVPSLSLAPGATLLLSVFYSGEIPVSTARLELIGTPVAKAAETDWDGIVPTSDEGATALRGFGEVLWYPCAAPTALLGEGNQLFAAVAQQRKLNASAVMRLRLTVVYAGDPPDAVVFNGQLEPLTHTADDQNQLVDETRGVATADFPLKLIGFRAPSLFLTAQRASPTDTPLLTVVSPVPEAAEPYATAVESLQPLFTDWFAATPFTPLVLLEHAGAPFEDAAFVAARLVASAEPANIAPELVRPLTHAFFSVSGATQTWLDQGLPEFMSLLWTERARGRDAALVQLQQNAATLAIAEPDFSVTPTPSGIALTDASSDVLLRFKSAAILWQLREILGEDTLRRCLMAYRRSLALAKVPEREPGGFERSLERTSDTDLAWFFDDWVYNDRGLPDLTIVQAAPRPILPKSGRPGGYLVAVDVHNDGFAVAEVPVIVRSGTLAASARLRIPARSTASTRLVFEGTPETVQVNDGSVPEVRTSRHTLQLDVRAVD